MREKIRQFTSLQINLFRDYYLNNFNIDKIVLPDIKFRHFRFQLFSERTSFHRIKDIIKTPKELHDKLVHFIPKNAYFTPVKWLNPIYVGHKKNELDVMLSFPLYFDIDMKDLDPPTFSQAKRNTLCLIDFLKSEYNRKPDLIVFSGRQGFHLFFWEWDDKDMLKLSPSNRIIEFKKSRRQIIESLKNQQIVVDNPITIDPYRIMKIPNTLHGKTGLIAKPITDIESFNPKYDAKAFSSIVYEQNFKIDWNVYV